MQTELPQHGDIVDTDVDYRGRLYIELFDADLGVNRRFYEDKRLTDKRETQRMVAQNN